MTERVDVEGLRALEAKATPGEWRISDEDSGRHIFPIVWKGQRNTNDLALIARFSPWSGASQDDRAAVMAEAKANAELAVALRNAAPSLLAEVAALRAENERLKAAAGMQPLVRDEYGVIRFKKNAIVDYIVDWCARKNGAAGYEPLDPRAPAPSLNEIAAMDFSAEDRMQLAQLIGYSVCGYGELSYTTDESYEEASKRAALAAQEPRPDAICPAHERREREA